ncbi:MAG: hypothetical protein SGI86_02840 [Deltaproteobacteria bacterium]|nr:hypothetical protein [Deltaproteobacteria bacterium]
MATLITSLENKVVLRNYYRLFEKQKRHRPAESITVQPPPVF